jgi:hypothetical protein
MGEKQTKNTKKMRAFLVALFFVFAVFFLFVNKSNAAEVKSSCTASQGTWNDQTGKCSCGAGKSPDSQGYCATTGGTDYTTGTPNDYNPEAGTVKSAFESRGNTTIIQPCGALDIKCNLKYIIYSIVVLFGWLVTIATVIFAWVVDAKNISDTGGILNNPAIKDVWIMVRDTLNMMFILVLLFAAFCTIFQVEKWNLKKVWLNVLINALLVNFSFTIARFIMDISNVIMYYFFANMFVGTNGTNPDGTAIFSAIASTSQLQNILIPGGDFKSAEFTYLIAAAIFMFIFAMTLLVLAFMFLIRLIALAIVIMFSPVGFVGYIFPSTAKFADDWWGALFKYSFFGPIMAFMMAVSIKMMNAFGSSSMSKTLKDAASKNIPGGANASVDANWVSSAAFFTIPIIVLWIAMGISQKLGIHGAGAVIGAVKKQGNAFAMKFSGADYLKKNYDAYKSKRDERQKEIDKKRWGGSLGNKINNVQDSIYANSPVPVLSGRAKKRYDKRKDAKNKDDIKDGAEEHAAKDDALLRTQLRDNINHPPTDEKAIMEHAINAKVALNRGAKYETDFENELKKDMKDGADRTKYTEFDGKKMEHSHAEALLMNHDRKPKGTSAAEVASWNATRSQLKDQAETARKEMESEEKKIIQKAKSEHIEALRKAVQAGEDAGKFKPRTPGPAGPPIPPSPGTP